METPIRSRRHRLCLLVVVGLVFGWATSSPAGKAHEPRVVVKYRESVDACVHCALAHGQSTGRTSLDAVHARLGVRRATAVFFEHHTLAGGRREAWGHRMRGLTTRRPPRSPGDAHDCAAHDLSGVYELELPKGADVDAAVAELAADPDVAYVEPVGRRWLSYVPNDPFFGTAGTWGLSYPDLWGLHLTQASTLWDVARGEGVVVAVVDTGVRERHRDLTVNIWRNPGEIRNRLDDDGNGFADDLAGWDFTREKGKQRDQNGHGTHVAGTIAAVGDDALGVLGMAWRAKIMALRAFDKQGFASTTDLAQAMVYAVENGADVINNSWGGFGPPAQVIADAVDVATAHGVLVVFAAGNDGRSAYALGDANLPDVMAVSASTPTDEIAGFSNWGDAISVAAPGVDILSTRGAARVGGQRVTGKYVRLSGTSMAAPHVAGLAALLISAKPGLTLDEIRWHLELNADQPGYPGYEGQPWNPYFGWGRINAANVLRTPPVTTRVKVQPTELHAFAGTTNPDLARLSVRFTTTADEAVHWTLAAPAGFTADPAEGDGDGTTMVGIDATALPPGPLPGAVGVSAPATADGGAARAMRTQLHADARVGAPVRLQENVGNGSDDPAVAGNGSTTIAVWGEHIDGLKAATFDAAGAVTSPITLMPRTCGGGTCWRWPSNAIDAGSNGNGFLVVYRSYAIDTSPDSSRETRREYIHALRVNADGTLVDGAPLEVASLVQTAPESNPSYDGWLGFPSVAFDGDAYVAIWTHSRENGGQTDTSDVWFRRVPVSGPLTDPPVKVYPRPETVLHQIVMPHVACAAPGDCLVAWIDSDGGTVPGGTLFERNMFGVRVRNGTAGPSVLAMENVNYNDFKATRVAAHPGGYAVLTTRNSCPTSGTSICGYDVVAALVGPDGVPVDPAGFRVNTRADDDHPYSRPIALAFDGTNFVAVYLDLRIDDGFDFGPGIFFQGYPLFAARFSPSGAVLDDEDTGRLVYGGLTALGGGVAQNGADTVVVWEDNRASAYLKFSIWAQRLRF